MIYLSTGGYKNQPAYVTVNELKQNGIDSFELSGGVYSDNNISELKKLSKSTTLCIHNYFPPPKDPFVINLASFDRNIREKSMLHAKNSIELAKYLGGKYYSIHAGFLFELRVSELGSKIESRCLNNRDESLKYFISNLIELSDYCFKKGMSLLVENNVVSPKNYMNIGADPCLMTTLEECEYVMQNTPGNVNMLLDFAHLKVTANALGFDREEFIAQCDSWIQAYHLSDNDGSHDNNQPFSDRSWFWPFINSGLDYYSIEVYNQPIDGLLNQYLLLAKKLNE